MIRRTLYLFSLLVAISSLYYCQAQPVQRAHRCVDAGANDTYACSPTPAVASLASLIPASGPKQIIQFVPNTSNTGAATLNVSGLGALAIVKYVGGAAVALSDNDLRAGGEYLLQYDSASGGRWHILSVLGNGGSGGGSATTETHTWAMAGSTSATVYPQVFIPATGGGSAARNGTAPDQWGTATLADGATPSLTMPLFTLHSGYASGGTFTFYWYTAVNGTNVARFDLGISCTSSGESVPQAETLLSAMVEQASAGNGLLNVATLTPSMTGCAAGDVVKLRLIRDGTHANDTLAGTVSILTASFSYTRNL